MDKQELLALYDIQLRIEIEHPGVRKETFPQLVRFIRPAPGMNFISYSRLDEVDLDTVIQEQIAYFSPIDQPFSWHVCEHDSPPNLKDRLMAHDFMPDDDPDAVMVLEVNNASPVLLKPPAIEVKRIEQRDQLDDVVQVEEQVWGGNFSWLKRRLGDHLEIPNYLSVYVAYMDGKPVCSSWIYFQPHGQFASLFGGATLPTYRKHGLYTALLAIRTQEAIRRGYRFVSTGASPMSRPILEKNGFYFLTFAYAYEWQRSPNNKQ
jgi:GNAT superfamily N-acetyltransferase